MTKYTAAATPKIMKASFAPIPCPVYLLAVPRICLEQYRNSGIATCPRNEVSLNTEMVWLIKFGITLLKHCGRTMEYII